MKLGYTESKKADALNPRVTSHLDAAEWRGAGLDIGGRGYGKNDEPIRPGCTIVDLGYPGYDGKTLPFDDASIGWILSSHTLEHIMFPEAAIQEWFRVLKEGGRLLIAVPHAYLYERRLTIHHHDNAQRPKSRWNEDHHRAYTPARLMSEIERALEPNSYRLIDLFDNDVNYDYSLGLNEHADGCYEIWAVIEKRALPNWKVEG